MNIKWLLVILLFSTSTTYAETGKVACNQLDTFMPYKAGIKAAESDNMALAFDIFCNLSFNGDYRAQFKLAQYYDGIHKSEEAENKVYAWVWASLSNSVVKSTKRNKYIEKLSIRMSNEELIQAQRLFAASKAKIPSGLRIDQMFEPLDYEAILKKYKRDTAPKEYTGSRLKKDKPPENLGIIQFN